MVKTMQEQDTGNGTEMCSLKIVIKPRANGVNWILHVVSTITPLKAVLCCLSIDNSRLFTDEKTCINKAIYALLMHGYAASNLLVHRPCH